MGFSSSAGIVVGISMAKLFKEFKEISEIHDEFDKFGKKTGKQFNVDKLIAVSPKGDEIIISEEKTNYGWNYDWYDSIGFDGGTYIGDVFNVTMGLHYGDYDTNDLHQIIMGIEVCDTESSNGGSIFVSRVDEHITNAAIDRVRKQLAEVFGYTGEINLYLINHLSY